MKRSKALGIAATVLAVLAVLFTWLAVQHYDSVMAYYRSAAKARDEVMVPTVLAFICGGAAILAGLMAIATKEK